MARTKLGKLLLLPAVIPLSFVLAQAPQQQTQTQSGPAVLTVTGDVPMPLTLKAEDLAAMPREKASIPEQDGTERKWNTKAFRCVKF
jgi:hypothetical protein